jgi:4-amino-4-deoxy-L-arabinose transferase-like glycosyltransferase
MATRRIVISGDYLTIEAAGQQRNKKPPGIYWLQSIPAGIANLCGVSDSAIWPYRITSFLGAMVSVLLTFHLGRRLFNAPVGYLAALMLAASTLLIVEAHLATTDAVLLAIVLGCLHFVLTIADGSVAEDDRVRSRYAPLFLWLLVGFGILIKGPIAPMVIVLTIIGLRIGGIHSPYFRWPRILAGLALGVAISLPWMLVINDGAFLREAIKGDLLPKLAGPEESHGFWPLFYLVILPATFFPGSLFLLASWKNAWQKRSTFAMKFCLACVVPTWLVFELIPTKLPHYVLPTFPVIAILIAASIEYPAQQREHRRVNLGWLPGLAIWCAIAIGFVTALTLLSTRIGTGFDPFIIIPMAGAFILSALGIGAMLRGFTLRNVEPLIWTSALLVPVALAAILPRTSWPTCRGSGAPSPGWPRGPIATAPGTWSTWCSRRSAPT